MLEDKLQLSFFWYIVSFTTTNNLVWKSSPFVGEMIKGKYNDDRQSTSKWSGSKQWWSKMLHTASIFWWSRTANIDIHNSSALKRGVRSKYKDKINNFNVMQWPYRANDCSSIVHIHTQCWCIDYNEWRRKCFISTLCVVSVNLSVT